MIKEDGYELNNNKMKALNGYIINQAYYNKLFRSIDNSKNIIQECFDYNNFFQSLSSSSWVCASFWTVSCVLWAYAVSCVL